MLTPNAMVSRGTMTTPPPSPVSDPTKPAASDPANAAAENSRLFTYLHHRKLVFFRFGAAVPSLGEVGNLGPALQHKIRLCPERALPYHGEKSGARNPQLVTQPNQFLEIRAKEVHLRIRMLPPPGESRRIERLPFQIFEFQQLRARRNQQPDRQLDRRDVFDQIQFVDRPQQ